MKKTLIIISAILLISSPVIAFAVNNGDEWNNNPSEATTGSSFGSTSQDICEQLFAGDPENIFREVFCSLVNISALSISDFASNLTCTIQKTGNEGNYRDMKFTAENNGKCTTNADLLKFGYGQSTNLTSSLKPMNTSDRSIYGTYRIARGIMTGLAVAFLMFLAFAQILHIDVNKYSIKKILPMLAVAVIGGWFSIYIVYLGSMAMDFLMGLSIFSPDQALNPMFNIFGGYLGNKFHDDIIAASATGPINSVNMVFEVGKTFTGKSSGVSFASGFLGSIMLLIPATITFLFEYVLALRPFVVQLLAMAAPLAFGSLVLPQTQFIFKKWWTYLAIALIYAPIVNFVFYVMNLLSTSGSAVAIIALWAIKTAVIVLLIRLPFTIESDIKKISTAISKTKLGGALAPSGKNKPKTESKIDLKDMQADKNLKTSEAQKLFAPVRLSQKKVNANNNITPSTPERTKTMDIGALRSILQGAHTQNSKRSTDLLAKSASDLDSNTVSKVINNSDLKIWKDNNLVEKLKTKDGQILDEEGAALRADSARRLARLAEVVESGNIANPEAVKFLSQKKALDQLPIHILKKAFEQGVINDADLKINFGENSEAVKSRFNSINSDVYSQNSQSVRSIIEQDHSDFMSGFKDIKDEMRDYISNPQSQAQSISDISNNIISNVKDSDKNAMDEFGLYYLDRLADINKQSKMQISDLLKNKGVNQQVASSLAQNQKMGLDSIEKYAPQLDQETKDVLKQSLMARDISSDLSNKIAGSVSEEKVLIQKGIAQKLQDSISNNMSLGDIKGQVSKSLEKLNKPISPEQAKEVAKDINKFYPGATVQTASALTDEDINKVRKRAENVLETVDTMEKTGTNKDSGKDVDKSIENQVNSTIKKVAEGSIRVDSAFNSNLRNIQNA